jgi:hypothetical protein
MLSSLTEVQVSTHSGFTMKVSTRAHLEGTQVVRAMTSEGRINPTLGARVCGPACTRHQQERWSVRALGE